MGKHRFVNVEFWQDAFVLDLTPEEKYFYLYIMTNSKTSQCGIYELPYRVIELETGYNRETVEKLLNRFVEYGKIKYSKNTKELFILNWAKFNWNNSEKVVNRIKQELDNVKEISFIEQYLDYVNSLEKNTSHIDYPYSIDSLWNKEKEKEKGKKKERKEEYIPFENIVDYLNLKTGKHYKHSTGKTKRCIEARWNEGFTENEFRKVIDNMTSQWLNDEKMNQYLRPETLFGTKFEGYLNQELQPSGVDQLERMKYDPSYWD
ncbi:conserved phage C-terminal domain-containing protein [Staphylococcus capitis subsp. urealyticus]|uniref:conserved phage C-terminal domain-containing protein n=1 Tax=Staphylococcus TaxID=1279 RepID=UPI00049F2019|nr:MULTISPECIES: conserved phage C-terminal domain-containing protein [Staphylococcus]KDE96599.1 replication protein [Staphylococcus sp. TE8]MBE7322921.1 conserved phage C-terminal domain-containing protein [Staphylococcus capitis]PAK62789.1 replication protein [Staphylococcus capitis]